MLGSPIQKNNLMSLLFSARKDGSMNGAPGDVGADEQQDFLKLLNTMKDTFHQARIDSGKSTENVGVNKKTPAEDKSDKATDTKNNAADENTEISQHTTSKIEQPKEPKQALSKTLDDLTVILQQWQQQISTPDSDGGEETEGEPQDDQQLSDALNGLLEEIQALQASLPQPVLNEPTPDLLSQINQPITGLPGAETAESGDDTGATDATGFSEAWDNALTQVQDESTDKIDVEQLTTETELPPEQIEIPQEAPSDAQPSATLDSAKLEKLMVKVANIMESAPEEAKTALQDVASKVKSLADVLADRPKGKSIQQMQFEAMQPSKPESKSSEEAPITSAFDSITLMGAASAQSVAEGITSINSTNAAGGNTDFQNAMPNALPAPHEQVVEAATMSIQAGKKEISIKLMPSELGEVRMTLNSTAQHVSARLVAETPEAKQALEKNLDQLVRSLEASGIKIGKIQVMQAGQTENSNNQFNEGNPQQSNQDSSLFQQQRQQQQQQQFSMANGFNHGNSSNSFTDGGSSLAGDAASSSQSFDTDVEGEEVSSTTAQRDDGSVDVRI